MHIGIPFLCLYMRKFIVDLYAGEIGLVGSLISPFFFKTHFRIL